MRNQAAPRVAARPSLGSGQRLFATTERSRRRPKPQRGLEFRLLKRRCVDQKPRAAHGEAFASRYWDTKQTPHNLSSSVWISCIWKEELLAIDLVAGDRVWRPGEISLSMNCCPSSFLTFGCRVGFTSITPYWLKSRLSPSTTIPRSPRFLNASHIPRSDRTKLFEADAIFDAQADFPARAAFGRREIDAGGVPKFELGNVSAEAVAARKRMAPPCP